MTLVDLDAVDGGDAPDQAEDHREVIRAEDVPGHQAVQDGVDEGQVVRRQEGEQERPDLERGKR